MSNPKARNAQHGARDAKPQRRPTHARDALDAEILRDLDIEKSSGDVRGGACPTSKPV